MILSFVSPEAAQQVLGAGSVIAALAYLIALATAESSQRRLGGVLPLAFGLHLLALLIDITGLGLAQEGARFGFAPALSMTTWLILAVYLVESRLVPLPGVRRVLSGLAAATVLLAWAFPGESRPAAASPWAPLHWVLGLASYGLFGVAVLHAAMLNRAESQMRLRGKGATAVAGAPLALGMPLLRLERLTFQFVGAGVAVLSLALLLGWWFTPHWRWDHKTLLSVLGWLVLSGLLLGRRVFGWRGRRATRWLYFGAALLLLSYAGTRFVLEVVLQRASGG
ncbi:cytochrome c biogenesis protein CcsA [Paucibacter sp. APW11]|uniref:Cytochrome c biogenesis protein CcsA n=1 Tax=Roseateles aquae TaxID=3077235 RepID=A0ABU3PF08_9BURK|nr:cytochrome c biogenesis protein CcsA [Paucibacter sp. APW11]MDT9001149.1 cytochrome c biogenesis protein CcsA [Paucibacter sp. APW11]